jgi:hypothetical protein
MNPKDKNPPSGSDADEVYNKSFLDFKQSLQSRDKVNFLKESIRALGNSI